MRTLAGFKTVIWKGVLVHILLKQVIGHQKEQKWNEGQGIDGFEYVKLLIIIYETY